MTGHNKSFQSLVSYFHDCTLASGAVFHSVTNFDCPVAHQIVKLSLPDKISLPAWDLSSALRPGPTNVIAYLLACVAGVPFRAQERSVGAWGQLAPSPPTFRALKKERLPHRLHVY